MGVTKLWQFLKEKSKGVELRLSQCSGQSWAVDLSGWILHGRSRAQNISGVSADFIMIRTVFYRALCLLEHGIRPVFVMDGRTAPEVKSQTLQDRSERAFSHTKMTATDRSGLQPMNKMCQDMLESLGLQVVSSSGEAEKTCALLNSQGIVDACLSDDSDALVYGANTVYRKLDVEKKTVQKHTLADLEENLNLNHQDLIVMALLSGCDYGDGVKGVGPQKVLELVVAMKKYSSNILQRVCGWRENADLISLEQEIQKVTKSTHCSQCQHTGRKAEHKKMGCSVCGSTAECSAESGRLCPCEYHTVMQRAKPFSVELDLRKKAIKQDNFPNEKLVEEFLNDKETFSISEVKVTLPQWFDLVQNSRISHQDIMKKMIPTLVHMHLYGTLELPEAVPESILNNCKRNSVPCYGVIWKRFPFDKWTPEPLNDPEKTPTKGQIGKDPYVVAVPDKLFEDKYPDMVRQHKLNTSEKKGKGKRPKDESQRKLTDIFSVSKAKKVLHFDEDAKP